MKPSCDFYRDGDGILDSVDNCIDVANGEQSDIDKDGLGLSEWV